MTTEEILKEIIEQRKVVDVLKLLLDYVIFESDNLRKDNMEYLSRLIAIRKINRTSNSKSKTEGIENLCDLEGYE